MLQVGFDVGGTNIAVGVVDDNKKIIVRRSVPFPTGSPSRQTAALMAALVEDMARELKVPVGTFASVGIAVPGSIDPACENVINAYNLQFHNVPLRALVSEYLDAGVPVYLANDANAAALAELHAGAFVGKETAVLITLGTGVGGGVILGGRMFNGGLGHGVELGHMILSHDGPLCTCGTRGCIEASCTATWLVQQGRRAVVDYHTSKITTDAEGNLRNVTAKMVVDCAKDGDTIALDIFERYVDQLGSALCSIIVLLDPEVIAIGGGVSHAGDFLFEPLRENVRRKCFFKEYGEIVPAVLGNDAGIIGAAMLGRN